MLHDWIIQRFIDHTFELKCPEMRLCITPAYTTEVFNGSGRIWITTAGQLRFSMLAKLTCSDLQREWLPRLKMLGHPPKNLAVKIKKYHHRSEGARLLKKLKKGIKSIWVRLYPYPNLFKFFFTVQDDVVV
ncbi:MAG TPA: hypothetical protein ACFYEF_03300 [Candidatus Wunengus sp. YC63]|uniref:hypothetical protein n=1 Tax=unclassified Candidatus Wunengus TaxID=3367695 RepID=UPI0040259445